MSLRFERGLTLRDALDILTGGQDEDVMNQVDAIYIAPPDSGVLTDEDSADEDDGGLIDNLSGKQLMSNAEIKMRDSTIISTSEDINSRPISEDCAPSTSSVCAGKNPLLASIESHTVKQSGKNYACDEDAYTCTDIMNSGEDNVVAVNFHNMNAKKSDLLESLLAEKQDEIRAKKKKTTIPKTWIDGDLEAPKVEFPQADFSRYRDFSASELFELFFDEEVFDILVRETAKYALFKNCPDPGINLDEMKCFLGILLFTGYHQLPGKRNYWSSEPDMHIEFIANAMRRNRFETIMRFLHCADNNDVNVKDKMWKLRPLLDKVKQNFIDHFVPVKELSYDESMVRYFGRHSCKQHIQGKPIRFGYKVWCLNTVCGYLVNFDVYQGKSLEIPTEYELLFGKSSSTLVKLLDDLPDEKSTLPYSIFFDNLFTNIYLLKYLQSLGYSAIGTIREDRIPKTCNLTEKKEMKKMPRGYHESLLCKEDSILICKWHDNGVVSIATNSHGVQPVTAVKRYSQEQKRFIQVERPAVFGEYNRNMGGTDKMDEHVGNYRIGVRAKKWYWPILTWIIDVSVQNAWHLRRNSGNKQPQLDFRRELVKIYVVRYGVAKKGPGKPLASKRSLSNSRVPDDLRYDRLDHFVISTPEKKKKRCAGEGCSSIIRTMCKKCNVGLCIECFSVFHENTYQ